MSRFFSSKYGNLIPYTPGEQPKDMKYVKLNTNESPFPPSVHTLEYAKAASENLQLYSDPECRDLVKAASEYFGVDSDQIIFTNGSDDILNFAFMAFCDEEHPAVFPNISYGFYPVFAEFNHIPYEEKPLNDDFTINVEDYIGVNKTVIIANPNAPTGIGLPLADIERIIQSNPDNVVVIDEAYVDFGGESAVKLVNKYENLLVTQTFSKSRCMAGARLGFGIGSKEIIRDLNTVRFSTNPYNINRMTMAAGIGALEDDEYFRSNCKKIAETRAWTVTELKKLGFEILDSVANFIFAKNPAIDGKELYLTLKEKGVLVRHFDKEKLTQYNRITIGSPEQMQILIDTVKQILEEKK